ncbi:MAG: hypothetical protein LQ342_002901 [Letrouitia transgressa]|nr:MAG: hypothetical protein LQ342_002901 [Letrouitia transgressa]
MIHERLWNYLQNMISRMFWGQEQFGGGFCGAGSRHKSVLKGGLRNLGTIESLLLLSEFHPRSMHFPPGDDGDDILVPEEDSISPINTHQESDVPSFGESTVLGWSEPALRSDRMCWSLIGTSYTLAYELGVFGNYQDELRFIDNGHSRDDTYRSQCGERAARIKRLMYIYVNSACGRFGFPSMYQGKDNETDLSNLEKTITTNPSELRESVELIQQCWAEITAINKACNANLFSSKEKTCELIKSGGYVAILKQLQPILDAWHRKIESLELSKYPRLILLIELEYNRVYVFSLALQAVLEHWTNNAGSNTENPEPHNSVSGLYRRSEYYVKEVAKAARNILRHVVEGLLPRDYLKHAPVRTHFRILSGAMFLLKTFALGAREDEVATSLRLLDSTVNALRSSVVDDVHLCLRVADLLESLTSSIRHNFVRLAARNSNNPTPTNSSLNPQHRVLSPSSQTPGLPDKPSPLPRRSPPAGLPPNPINPQANTNNIAIMPPPNNAYYVNNNFFSNSFPSPSSTESPNSYPNKSSANSGELPSFPTEEDWLTLDLNPLLTDTGGLTSGGGGMGGDSQWFGNFGPDIDGNLEMLGNWLRDGRWTG